MSSNVPPASPRSRHERPYPIALTLWIAPRHPRLTRLRHPRRRPLSRKLTIYLDRPLNGRLPTIHGGLPGHPARINDHPLHRRDLRRGWGLLSDYP